MNTNIQLSIILIGEKRLYSLRAFHCQWNEWHIYSGFFKGSLATARWFSSSLPFERFHLQCGFFQGKERIFLCVAVALTRKSKSVGNFRVIYFAFNKTMNLFLTIFKVLVKNLQKIATIKLNSYVFPLIFWDIFQK